MDEQLEQIRDQQKQSWNKFSSGWKTWDNLVTNFAKPVGDEIIRKLNLTGDELVLDIASGTGEPGLSIAGKLKKGKVIATDLSDKMLDVAKENAEKKQITNFETKVCDVSELPFPDNTFDAVSCRFGFMFFPDMQLAANEMYRVLKPGGKMVTSVWNVPEKNFWVTAMMGVITKNIELPKPPPGAPGMFRCAQNGVMKNIFQKAGFKNISETEVSGKMEAGTTELYWNFMNDVAAPVVAALSNAEDAMKNKIKKEVSEAITEKYPEGKVAIDSSAIVICTEK